MKFIKQYKAYIISALVLITVLIISFFASGNNKDIKIPDKVTSEQVSVPDIATPVPQQKQELSTTSTPKPTPAEKKSAPQKTQSTESKTAPDTASGAEATPTPEPIPETTPLETPQTTPVIPEEENILTCTISVRCDTINNNLSQLKPEKLEIVPQNGIILKPQKVSFNEGDSAFDCLVKTMQENSIHLEFVKTPGTNSYYIEGISNIYEFDCGDLSGWVYKVNDVVSNKGCSDYILNDGDIIEWIYSCDLGRDI